MSKHVPGRSLAVFALVAAAVACAVAAGVAARERVGSATLPTFAGPLPGLGILRAAHVAPGILRGGRPDAEGLFTLRSMGVRTIVDLTIPRDGPAAVEAAGMTLVAIPMAGGRDAAAPNEAQLRRFFEIVLDPARRPVFVHCHHGKDRTGALFAAYRIEVDGWTPERALDEMRAFGSRDDHSRLTGFVRGYTRRGFADGAR